MSAITRTEAAMMLASDADGAWQVCELCAKLETELAAANKEIERLKKRLASPDSYLPDINFNP